MMAHVARAFGWSLAEIRALRWDELVEWWNAADAYLNPRRR